MMKKITIMIVLVLAIGGITTPALTEEAKPIQLSLTPDIALFNRHTMIHGVTLSIWGENPQESLALGLVNGSTGRSAGLSLGIVNYADSYQGVMWSTVNYTKSQFSGWQGGIVNCTKGSVTGLQTGVVNYAGSLTGLQFGLVNYAHKTGGGLQIGLVNVIPDNKWFTRLPHELAPAMLLVNWRF